MGANSKTVILLSCVLLLAALLCRSAFARWPVTGDTPAVCGSYGTMEETVFHDGIDVRGRYGIDRVRTVTRVKVLQLDPDPEGRNENIALAEVDEGGRFTGTCFRYHHLIVDRSVAKEGAILPEGTVFADVTNRTAGSNDEQGNPITRGPSFQHTHILVFRYDHPEKIKNWLDDKVRNTIISPNTVNPLNNKWIDLGVKDPGGKAPKIGPVFLKNWRSDRAFVPAKTPFLYGRVKILAEITDDMGYVGKNGPGDPGYVKEPDSWQPVQAKRVDAIVSSPYSCGYRVVDPDDLVLQEGSHTFDRYVNGESLRKLYDQGYGAYRNTYYYCYSLTSMLKDANGRDVVGDGWWNTRLKDGEPWNGADALINAEAKYRDGVQYRIRVFADDLEVTHSTSTDVPVLLDNFRPYVERLQVDGGYDEGWQLSGKALHRVSGGSLEVAAGTHTLTAVFSEPVRDVVVTINGNVRVPMSSDQPEKARTKFYGRFILLLNNPSASEARTVTITARDLAGNELLAINSRAKKIDPRKTLTRSSNGKLPATGGPDTSHHFIVTGN